MPISIILGSEPLILDGEKRSLYGRAAVERPADRPIVPGLVKRHGMFDFAIGVNLSGAVGLFGLRPRRRPTRDGRKESNIVSDKLIQRDVDQL